MEESLTAVTPGETAPGAVPGGAASSGEGQPAVTVRYWAAARAAAGCAEETFRGGTVGEVLDSARAAHSDEPRFDKVLSICSLLLGEQPIGSRSPADVAVAEGDVVEVLPPFAGGTDV